MDTSANTVEVPASAVTILIAASFDGSIAAVNRGAADLSRQIEDARRTASQAVSDARIGAASPPFGPRDRVRHSNPARSYGAGIVISVQGATATVRFDGERGQRLVLVRDLSPEAMLPLAVRVPARRSRVIYPVQA